MVLLIGHPKFAQIWDGQLIKPPNANFRSLKFRLDIQNSVDDVDKSWENEFGVVWVGIIKKRTERRQKKNLTDCRKAQNSNAAVRIPQVLEYVKI